MKPMNYASVEVGGLPTYIDDPAYTFEQKMDGTRAIIRIDRKGMTAYGRHGGELKHTAATQHLSSIYASLSTVPVAEGEAVFLDGEIMIENGMFHVFDMPSMLMGSVRVTVNDPYWKRRQELSEVMETVVGPKVNVVGSYGDPMDKAQLVQTVRDWGAEGVMVKDWNAAYTPGGRASHSFKAKFIKTVDVVVTHVQREVNGAGVVKTGSITFAAYHEGELRKLGSCSAIGKPLVEAGDVIEVAYLAWTPGGGLREPRMAAPRQDKNPEDCLWDQLEPYSKRAV